MFHSIITHSSFATDFAHRSPALDRWPSFGILSERAGIRVGHMNIPERLTANLRAGACPMGPFRIEQRHIFVGIAVRASG